MANIFDRQIMWGMFIGLLIGIITSAGARFVGVLIPIPTAIFWGAVIGGFAAYFPRFSKLGEIITRRPQQGMRNMIVGILALALFALILIGISVGGGWLLTRCFPGLE